MDHRAGAVGMALAAALVLAGCASDHGTRAMTQEQLDAIGARYDAGAMTVGDSVALAPEGTLGMIDARIAAGVGDAELVFSGTPPEDVHDWTVIGMCVYPGSVPSVEVAAVPAEDVEAVTTGPGLALDCDGAPADLIEG